MPYTAKKNLDSYRKISQNSSICMDDNETIGYEIESKLLLEIGDCVQFKGSVMIVMGTTAEIVKGLLTYRYVLGFKEGVRCPRIYNQKIQGVSLEGSILQSSSESVKVHLHIDKNQDKKVACYFPYAAQSNNMMYCMPEIGDSINLYFPSYKEEEVIAVNAVRKNGAHSSKTQDPNVLYFDTPYGRELKMGYTDVSYTAQKDKLHLKLDEKTGIEIKSHKDIIMPAIKGILIESKKSIGIYAGGNIRLANATTGGGIFMDCMDENTHILDRNIFEEGYRKITLPRLAPPLAMNTYVEQAKAKPKEKKNWWKAGLKVLGAIAVVAAVASITVATGGLAGPVFAAVGAGFIVGAAIGVGVTATVGVIKGTNSSWEDYLENAINWGCGGAISGAVFAVAGVSLKGLTFLQGLGQTAGLGGVSGALVNHTDQMVDYFVDGTPVSVSKLALATAEGAVVSGVLYTVGYGVSKIYQGVKGKASAKKAVPQKAVVEEPLANKGVDNNTGGGESKSVSKIAGEGAVKTERLITFKGDEAVIHFDKHGKEIMDSLGNNSYNLKQYVQDANYIIKNGEYVPEINGYVTLMGGKGSAKYGFVGLDRATGKITTFHLKTAGELAKKAPSLGISK